MEVLILLVLILLNGVFSTSEAAIIAARKAFMTATPFKRQPRYAFIQTRLCLHSLLTQPTPVITGLVPVIHVFPL